MTKIELNLKPLVWTPTYNNYYMSLSSKYQKKKAKLILIRGFCDFPLIIGGRALLHIAESSKFMKSGVFSRGLLRHVWSGKMKHRSKPDNLVWPKFHPIQTCLHHLGSIAYPKCTQYGQRLQIMVPWETFPIQTKTKTKQQKAN